VGRKRRKAGQMNVKSESASVRLIIRILNLPRVARISLIGGFALTTTLAVSPLVDEIYLRFFFDESTRIVPSFVSVSIGLVMYLVGWKWVIGTIGESPQVETKIIWYFAIGAMSLILVLVWLLRLLTLGNASFF
jgi:hypothetical protein